MIIWIMGHMGYMDRRLMVDIVPFVVLAVIGVVEGLPTAQELEPSIGRRSSTMNGKLVYVQ